MNIKSKLHWDAKRLAPPAILGGLAIFYMVIASGFSDDGSAQAPMLYGGALLGLSVLVFLLALVPGLKPAPKFTRIKHPAGPFPWKTSLQIFGLIVAFIALIFLLGFYLAIPLFLLVFLRWISGVSWLGALICAAVSYGFIWAIFSYFLHLEVFTGYLSGFV